MREWCAVAAAALLGCGASPEVTPVASESCRRAERLLEAKVGPELGEVKGRLELPVAPDTPELTSPRGCALAYTQVPEELSDEVADEAPLSPANDHQLAISIPDAKGNQTLTLIEPSETSPGGVLLTLSLKDIDSDGQLELVVQEDAGVTGEAYRGLRLFEIFQEPSPRSVFSDALSVVTPEGLSVLAVWEPAVVNGKQAIVLEGVGRRKVYIYSTDSRTYALDEAATNSVNPAPPAPPPAPEVKATPKAEEAVKPEAPPKASKKKGKQGKKKEEKATPAIPIP